MKNNDLTNNVSKRLTYLSEKFNIVDTEILNEMQPILIPQYSIYTIKSEANENVLAVLISGVVVKNGKEYVKIKVKISKCVFDKIVKADPTENKEFTQWMLKVFKTMLKDGHDVEAIRFIEEDLSQANLYLDLFRKNKNKRLFKDLCKTSFTAPKNDPGNINQYTSLAQLFDAVDPFTEREPSNLERTIKTFCDSGQAEIPYRDRKFTLYTPFTTEASCIMSNFASWCTAKPENSMFKSYTTNNKLPNGDPSKMYIIIDNELFTGKSNKCYQIHFETKQVKGRENGSNINLYEPVFSKSEGLGEYFKHVLLDIIKHNPSNKNNYVDFLVKFGYSDSLFEAFDENVPAINFTNIEIPKLPDIGRFKSMDELILINTSLVELHKSVGELTNLELLSLTNNKLTSLPKEIGNLKKLEVLTLNGNSITEFPDEIKYLDKTNGGRLFKLSIDNLDDKTYTKLQSLLPSVSISLPVK